MISECNFELRNKDGNRDKYSFKRGTMSQKNIETRKIRQLRAPWGMFPPKQAMLPNGDMIVIALTAEQAGKKVIELQDPRRKDRSIKVSIPAKARKGQKIAIPIPGENELVEDVAKKQAELNKGMSTGAKVAVGAGITAAAGAGVVGGVILGDHLAGGTLTEDVADIAVEVGKDVAEFAVDAGEAIGDFAEDVGEWLGDTGEDVGDWICRQWWHLHRAFGLPLLRLVWGLTFINGAMTVQKRLAPPSFPPNWHVFPVSPCQRVGLQGNRICPLSWLAFMYLVRFVVGSLPMRGASKRLPTVFLK